MPDTRAGIAPTWQPPDGAQYVEEGYWQGRLADGFLAEAARRHPERTALVDRERRVSYAELDGRIEGAAGMLSELGVGKGDVVTFQLPNWLEASIVFHATARLGAISNPVIPIYRGREVSFILAQARSRVLVIPDVFRGFDFREMVAEIRADLPELRHVLVVGEPANGMLSFDAAPARGESAVANRREASDIVLLLYTSGTEANPKGVLHSHDTLVYECQSIIDMYQLTEDDRVIMPSPVTHITGLLYGLILPFMLGTTVVLQDTWNAPAAFDLIEREGCTFSVGATPFLHGLTNIENVAEHRPTPLRVFLCGGADVPPALIRLAHERLGIRATRVYGSSECPISTGSPLDVPENRHADTDGRAINPTEARIVDDAGVELPRNISGELQVRGPDLFLGYLDASLNDRAITHDGWFRTGDLAVMDDEGYIRISGRAKDIILRGGENLSAKEIEDLLFEHPDVDDVAVVGYPDAVLGERACAFVVSKSSPTLEQLVTFLRGRRVANQKLPEQLRIVSSLPKTASGKVQKFRLREALRMELAEGIGHDRA